MAASLRNTKFDNIVDEEEEELERKLRQADLDRVRTEAEAVRNKGDEEDEYDSDDEMESPLFWTKPPSMRKNATTDQLEMEKMFNSMIYDDKPVSQLAVEAKERGNMALQQGYYDVARDAYKEALKFARQAWTEEHDSSQLISVVLCNRAQVELKVKNYRQAIKDCQASLKLVHGVGVNNKAKFRGAKACLAVNKPGEALQEFLHDVEIVVEEEEASSRALTTSTAPPAVPPTKDKAQEERRMLSQLKRECMSIKAKLDTKEEQRLAKLAQVHAEELRWRTLYGQHGVKIGPLTMDLQPYTGGSEVAGGPGPRPAIRSSDSATTWAWPVLFMYPEHAQSDFVQEFEETVAFRDMLGMMFPGGEQGGPEWDVQGHYREWTDLELYVRERQVEAYDLTRPLVEQANMDVSSASSLTWFKIPMARTLSEVLRHDKLVVPGIPTFVVLSRKNPSYLKTFLDACKRTEGRSDAVRKM